MEEEIKINKQKKLWRILGALAFFVLVFLMAFYYLIILPREEKRESERAKRSHESWIASTLHNSPEALQNSFSDDVKNGVNDQYTKADAYWITHRYSDTLGNVYEIYDYIQSRPHLAFIQVEAETIYPEVFERLKKHEVGIGTNFARYAYLAYIEVLKNHGYMDISGIGTASNQYAKTAYFNTTIANHLSNKDKKVANRITRFIGRDTEKSIEFANYAKEDVVKILDGKLTDKDIPARDILVGLNQYAAGLRYRQAIGVDYDSPKSADEIFDFTTEYARKYVPQLTYFTAILNASTLSILNPEDPRKIKEALYPILNLDTKKASLLDASIVHHIIDAKFEPKNGILMADLDMYGKRNVVRLASRVHEFKLWLMANGWTEKDFE